MNKNAIILAAGRGSRMGKSTERTHKCLTKLIGKTLLEWQIQTLESVNINNIKLISGYKSELLSGNFSKIQNTNWSKTNMVYSLFCAPRINTDTLVCYSDIVYSKKHVIDLIESDGEIVITADKNWLELWSKRFNNPLDDAESFKTNNNRLIEIGKKQPKVENIEAQYMGLLKFSINGWDLAYKKYKSLDEDKQLNIDMTSFLSLLINETTINVVFVEGKWCEVDTESDAILYENSINSNSNWSHDWR
jgi:choline kinase